MKSDSHDELPLFYRHPRPLDVTTHAGLSLKTDAGFGFANQTNAVPLAVSEFSLASRHYPIVFAGSPNLAPHAVLGLHTGENLFVGADGKWAEDCYIPAYVRRYPFIFLELKDQQKFALCIDEQSDLLVKGGENPLFQDREPSAVTRSALDLCTAFQGHFASTHEFSMVIKGAQIFEEYSANIEFKSGEKMTLGPFQVVNEEKFNALEDQTFLDWRAKGWLAPVYFHLAAFHNWAGLVNRTGGANRDG